MTRGRFLALSIAALVGGSIADYKLINEIPDVRIACGDAHSEIYNKYPQHSATELLADNGTVNLAKLDQIDPNNPLVRLGPPPSHARVVYAKGAIDENAARIKAIADADGHYSNEFAADAVAANLSVLATGFGFVGVANKSYKKIFSFAAQVKEDLSKRLARC
jgi:hypothetical protein